MYQELGYLRDELNQRVHIYDISASKTIHAVLLVWGGLGFILGNGGIKFIEKGTENGFENIPLYFIAITILFISNLVLYFMALQHRDTTGSAYRHGAYITVFYEKQLSSAADIGKNFIWESANFEIQHNKKADKSMCKKRYNTEYFVLTIVSMVFMFLLEVAFFYFDIFKMDRMEQATSIILLSMCVIYLGFSIYWLCKIPGYTYLWDSYGIRIKYLREYIDYACSKGPDIENELKKRLGGVWNIVYPENPVTKS